TPYITVEGYSIHYWQSASDLGTAIYNTIVTHNYGIDYASIQFRADQSGPAPNQPPLQGTPYPNPNPAIPRAPDGSCNYSQLGVANWLACELGVTPTTAVVIGAVGALIGVVLITRR